MADIRIKDNSEETTLQDNDAILLQRSNDIWAKLSTLATYIKSKIATATTSVSGLMSSTDKAKLDKHFNPDGSASFQSKMVVTNSSGNALDVAALPTGTGDMEKSAYDSNDDGTVDSADEADAISGTPGNDKMYTTDGSGNQQWESKSAVTIGNSSDTDKIQGVPAVRWQGQTTDATPTEIFVEGVASDRYAPSANGVVGVLIKIVAEKDDFSEGGIFIRQALFSKNGASVSILGAVQTVGTDIDSGTLSLAVSLTADAVNSTLKLTVTGAAGNTINWKALGTLIEV